MGKKNNLPGILLVEGKDDMHVILALCQKFNIPENFSVHDCEGIEPLLDQIGVWLKSSAVKNLGIIVDADTDIAARWQQLKEELGKLQVKLPETLDASGYIGVNEKGQKVGIWMMPNNNLNGMLEDFIQFLVPPNDALLPEARQILATLEAKEVQQYKDVHQSKALIHTWLAWQEDPGTPLGLAITKKYLTVEEENCRVLMTWISKVFA